PPARRPRNWWSTRSWRVIGRRLHADLSDTKAAGPPGPPLVVSLDHRHSGTITGGPSQALERGVALVLQDLRRGAGRHRREHLVTALGGLHTQRHGDGQHEPEDRMRPVLQPA